MTPSPAPSAALMHAVVATGLTDPDRLREWSQRPASLTALGVDPSAMDLDTLADFAGLAEKVRHNACRTDLQLTFRLLLLTGLEIELFREYAPRSLARRRRGLTSGPHRREGLVEFVAEWASGDDPVRRIIYDVLRHEDIAATVRELTDASVPGGTPSGGSVVEPGPQAVPRHRGYVAVHRMNCDPRQVGDVLRDRDPDLGRIVTGPRTFVYHWVTAGPLRMVEVDDGLGELVRWVDGRTTVAGIRHRLLAGNGSDGAIVAVLTQLSELGLITWHSAEGLATCD
jgi:hypothetical protein